MNIIKKMTNYRDSLTLRRLMTTVGSSTDLPTSGQVTPRAIGNAISVVSALKTLVTNNLSEINTQLVNRQAYEAFLVLGDTEDDSTRQVVSFTFEPVVPSDTYPAGVRVVTRGSTVYALIKGILSQQNTHMDKIHHLDVAETALDVKVTTLENDVTELQQSVAPLPTKIQELDTLEAQIGTFALPDEYARGTHYSDDSRFPKTAWGLMNTMWNNQDAAISRDVALVRQMGTLQRSVGTLDFPPAITDETVAGYLTWLYNHRNSGGGDGGGDVNLSDITNLQNQINTITTMIGTVTYPDSLAPQTLGRFLNFLNLQSMNVKRDLGMPFDFPQDISTVSGWLESLDLKLGVVDLGLRMLNQTLGTLQVPTVSPAISPNTIQGWLDWLHANVTQHGENIGRNIGRSTDNQTDILRLQQNVMTLENSMGTLVYPSATGASNVAEFLTYLFQHINTHEAVETFSSLTNSFRVTEPDKGVEECIYQELTWNSSEQIKSEYISVVEVNSKWYLLFGEAYIGSGLLLGRGVFRIILEGVATSELELTGNANDTVTMTQNTYLTGEINMSGYLNMILHSESAADRAVSDLSFQTVQYSGVTLSGIELTPTDVTAVSITYSPSYHYTYFEPGNYIFEPPTDFGCVTHSAHTDGESESSGERLSLRTVKRDAQGTSTLSGFGKYCNFRIVSSANRTEFVFMLFNKPDKCAVMLEMSGTLVYFLKGLGNGTFSFAKKGTLTEDGLQKPEILNEDLHWIQIHADVWRLRIELNSQAYIPSFRPVLTFYRDPPLSLFTDVYFKPEEFIPLYNEIQNKRTTFGDAHSFNPISTYVEIDTVYLFTFTSGNWTLTGDAFNDGIVARLTKNYSKPPFALVLVCSVLRDSQGLFCRLSLEQVGSVDAVWEDVNRSSVAALRLLLRQFKIGVKGYGPRSNHNWPTQDTEDLEGFGSVLLKQPGGWVDESIIVRVPVEYASLFRLKLVHTDGQLEFINTSGLYGPLIDSSTPRSFNTYWWQAFDLMTQTERNEIHQVIVQFQSSQSDSPFKLVDSEYVLSDYSTILNDSLNLPRNVHIATWDSFNSMANLLNRVDSTEGPLVWAFRRLVKEDTLSEELEIFADVELEEEDRTFRSIVDEVKTKLPTDATEGDSARFTYKQKVIVRLHLERSAPFNNDTQTIYNDVKDDVQDLESTVQDLSDLVGDAPQNYPAGVLNLSEYIEYNDQAASELAQELTVGKLGMPTRPLENHITSIWEYAEEIHDDLETQDLDLQATEVTVRGLKATVGTVDYPSDLATKSIFGYLADNRAKAEDHEDINNLALQNKVDRPVQLQDMGEGSVDNTVIVQSKEVMYFTDHNHAIYKVTDFENSNAARKIGDLQVSGSNVNLNGVGFNPDNNRMFAYISTSYYEIDPTDASLDRIATVTAPSGYTNLTFRGLTIQEGHVAYVTVNCVRSSDNTNRNIIFRFDPDNGALLSEVYNMPNTGSWIDVVQVNQVFYVLAASGDDRNLLRLPETDTVLWHFTNSILGITALDRNIYFMTDDRKIHYYSIDQKTTVLINTDDGYSPARGSAMLFLMHGNGVKAINVAKSFLDSLLTVPLLSDIPLDPNVERTHKDYYLDKSVDIFGTTYQAGYKTRTLGPADAWVFEVEVVTFQNQTMYIFDPLNLYGAGHLGRFVHTPMEGIVAMTMVSSSTIDITRIGANRGPVNICIAEEAKARIGSTTAGDLIFLWISREGTGPGATTIEATDDNTPEYAPSTVPSLAKFTIDGKKYQWYTSQSTHFDSAGTVLYGTVPFTINVQARVDRFSSNNVNDLRFIAGRGNRTVGYTPTKGKGAVALFDKINELAQQHADVKKLIATDLV